MRRAWLLLAVSALAAGGCGQKGPLYLPDKGGKVVTSAPPAAPSSPAAPAAPKRGDKDQDQESQPPK